MSTSPVAVDDFASTNRNTPVIIPVLANDSDADGDPLSVEYIPDGPLNGGLTNNLDGTFTFTPSQGFVGVATFNYRVSDGTTYSNTAIVSIDVVVPPNHAPVAVDDSITTNKNTPITFSVLTNDTDADGNALTTQYIPTGSLTGSLINNGNGTYTYTPQANVAGVTSFTYRASDGAAFSNTATVTITIPATELADTVNGDGGDNVLNGLGGADIMQGLGGNDTLHGGEGNDTISGDSLNNAYNGPSGNDIVFGEGGDDQLMSSAGVDYYDGGSGVDRVNFVSRAATQGVIANLLTQTIANDGFGNSETMVSIEGLNSDTAYADQLTGDNNDNVLRAGIGDTIIANGGNDAIVLVGAAALLDGGDGVDVVVFTGAQGAQFPDSNNDGLSEIVLATHGVNVDLGASVILDDGFGLSGAIINMENVSGSTFADILVGDGNANVLSGGLGDDDISGGGGDDTLIGGTGLDSLTGGTGRDTASYFIDTTAMFIDLAAGETRRGSASAAVEDTLTSIENATGGAGNDTITGTNAANTLLGNGGADAITGAGGGDDIDGGAGADTIVYVIGDGADTVNGGADFDTLTIAGTTAANTLNVSYDGVALTTFESGSLLNVEAVTADLGLAVDTLTYAGTTAGVAVNLSAGTASGFVSISGVEDVTSDSGDDVLIGDGAANHLSGGGGNDILSGGAGSDILSGGLGVDTASYASETDDMFINLSPGNTRRGSAGAAIEDTLQGIENASGGAGGDTITGTNSANVLMGNGGADTIVGAGGVDTINGGGGDDAFLYAIGDGADTVDGGADFDTLSVAGTGSANTLDVIYDGASLSAVASGSVVNVEAVLADLGGGLDTVTYAGSTASVSANLGAGTASGFASILGVENVTGGDGADTLTGDSGDNRLEGGGGADILNGGAGGDVLNGGGGDDSYFADASDVINESANSGADAVFTSSATFALSANVENLTFTGVGAFQASGNGSDNFIIGGDGGNVLDGNGGADTLVGGAGTDTLTGGAGNDHLRGGGGNDSMNGGTGNDVFILDAGFGQDTVSGFDANPVNGQDLLDVSALGIDSGNFAARVSIVDLGADTQITIDGASIITLFGVTGANENVITQSDFIFV